MSRRGGRPLSNEGRRPQKKERFQTELKDLLVDAEQLNLQAKEIFKNIVLKDRAHNEGDLDEAVRYEREVNRRRLTFDSQFVTLKTRFDHMKFLSPDTGRAELANAISSWERVSTGVNGKFTETKIIEGEEQFIQAKRRLEFYFH
jgi:hypothetical protein